MKLIFCSLLLCLLPILAPAQISNAEIQRRAQSDIPDTLDAQLCDQYIAQAQQEIAQGKLHLDKTFLPETIQQSRTFWELLALEYEVTATAANGGDFLPQETRCYNEWMLPAIEAKYGRGILSRVAARADSLNASGRGFRDAHPAGVATAEDLLLQRFSYKADFRQNHRLHIFLTFEVDQAGHVNHLHVRWCATCVGPVMRSVALPSTHRYYVEAQRILRSRRWQPATLGARPLKTTIGVELSYLSFYPNAMY